MEAFGDWKHILRHFRLCSDWLFCCCGMYQRSHCETLRLNLWHCQSLAAGSLQLPEIQTCHLLMCLTGAICNSNLRWLNMTQCKEASGHWTYLSSSVDKQWISHFLAYSGVLTLTLVFTNVQEVDKWICAAMAGKWELHWTVVMKRLLCFSLLVHLCNDTPPVVAMALCSLFTLKGRLWCMVQVLWLRRLLGTFTWWEMAQFHTWRGLHQDVFKQISYVVFYSWSPPSQL